MIAQKL